MNTDQDLFLFIITGIIFFFSNFSKYDCIHSHIGADDKCGPKGEMHYIDAVNIHKGMAELRDSECSGVGIIGMSFSAMLAPLLLLFVL